MANQEMQQKIWSKINVQYLARNCQELKHRDSFGKEKF